MAIRRLGRASHSQIVDPILFITLADPSLEERTSLARK